MARQEHRREDLLRDARALSPRLLLKAAGAGLPSEDVFAGWRGDSLSLYFDEDPVYHFNAAGELRRGYLDGRLIKAEEACLIAMTRKRKATVVQLVRYELSQLEQAALFQRLESELVLLRQVLEARRDRTVGETPDGSQARERLQAWLAAHPIITAAGHPRVG